MGKSISRLAKRFFPNCRSKILMVGLDASGKTTILYRLMLGEIVTTMPTIGFNVETVEYRNISFSIWDVGGQSKVRVAAPQAVCRQKLVNVLLPNPDITNFWMQKEAIRPLWRHYFENTQGLIFVVDSSDRERIPEARNELHRILGDEELSNAALLVFANKQDFPYAMPASEIADKLGLYSLGQRCWYIQSTSATSGEGLYEGLDWLSNSISRKEGSKNAK